MRAMLFATLLTLSGSFVHAGIWAPDAEYVPQKCTVKQSGLAEDCEVAKMRLQFNGVADPDALLNRLAKIQDPNAVANALNSFNLIPEHEKNVRECIRSIRKFEFYLEKMRNAADASK